MHGAGIFHSILANMGMFLCRMLFPTPSDHPAYCGAKEKAADYYDYNIPFIFHCVFFKVILVILSQTDIHGYLPAGRLVGYFWILCHEQTFLLEHNKYQISISIH
jgi:hypothetical protein